MMLRSNTFPSLSSSRQMMMAWKVSGLSHRPAIIASRPASMRLAMAISPSRDKSSTEPISRRYMRTGSSVRSAGSLASDLAGTFLLDLDQLAALALGLLLGLLARLLAVFARLLGLDDVNAHLAEHGEHVFDLLGIDLLGGQHRVDLVMGHVAAFLGGADQLLDRGVGEVEQRQRRVRRLGRLFFRRFFFFFFLLRCLGLARHTSSPGDAPPRGRRSPHHPYPMRAGSNGRLGAPVLARAPCNPPDSDPRSVTRAA